MKVRKYYNYRIRAQHKNTLELAKYVYIYIYANWANTHGSTKYLAYSARHTPLYQRPLILKDYFFTYNTKKLQPVRNKSQ